MKYDERRMICYGAGQATYCPWVGVDRCILCDPERSDFRSLDSPESRPGYSRQRHGSLDVAHRRGPALGVDRISADLLYMLCSRNADNDKRNAPRGGGLAPKSEKVQPVKGCFFSK